MKKESYGWHLMLVAFLVMSGNIYGNAFSWDHIKSAQLYFVENRGQLDPRVAYYLPGVENTLYFTNNGVTFRLSPKKNHVVKSHLENASLSVDPLKSEDLRPWTLRLEFVGSNPESKLEARQVTPAVFSYFRGDKEKWKTGLKTYASLKYSNLYNGIDLIYTATFSQVKYEFLVKPGADPTQIEFKYSGATDVTLTETGGLQITTPRGSFQDGEPFAYQEVNGKREKISAGYSLKKKDGSYSYHFQIGSYDKSKPLILDPVIFIYSGYIGGVNNDSANAVAVDAAGFAYIVGQTGSDQFSFPVKIGPDLSYNGSYADAFIAKIGPEGLSYVGYIGGTGEEGATDVAVDGAGNAYVTGSTNSAYTFPVIGGPFLSYAGGSSDAFVTQVNPTGTSLIFSGFFGGKQNDLAVGIALDSLNYVYITGQTDSDESTFPVFIGPDLTYNGGPNDAFVAKITPAGTAIEYCGYIGGDNDDTAGDIAVNRGMAPVISGTTSSTELTFPVLVGPDLTYNGGTSDAFVARVMKDGTGLISAGYIGGDKKDGAGSGFEFGGVALDSGENIYVAGNTMSNELSFPVIGGPDLTFNGDSDGFVAKINRWGSAIIYCGYIGGKGDDHALDIAVDNLGNAYVSGCTTSDESTFPVLDGPDITYNGGFLDAFVARVNATGLKLDYCGYIGGDDVEVGMGVAVDKAMNAYVAGYTFSTEASFPVLVGPYLKFNGGTDAFITKISPP